MLNRKKEGTNSHKKYTSSHSFPFLCLKMKRKKVNFTETGKTDNEKKVDNFENPEITLEIQGGGGGFGSQG